MTRPVQGLVGGAQAAITTSPVAVNLTALAGRTVYVWSDDDDLWFTFAAVATDTTLVTSGASAASTTSLKADRVAKGSKSPRLVEGKYPFLIVRCVTLTGTVHVKVASEIDGCDAAPGTASAPAVGSITGTVSTIQGAPTKTSNTTYQASVSSMGADIDCAAITVGPEGRLEISAKWVNTSAPIGVLVVQALSVIDGTTYVDIPGSSGGFGQHPNNDTAETIGYFRELQPFTTVRLKYRRTSGGAAGNNFTAATRVM